MAIKMDKTTIIVCSVVGSLGVLSAILGFSAEGTKLTPYTILVYGDDCIYPQNPALGLGVCAAIFLLVAQITISAVAGCCGCCKSRSIPSDQTKRNVVIVCAVFSWVAAVIAWALLIQGASWNAEVVRVAAPYCPYLKDGIFAGGAVLTLAATALGITSFIMMRRQPVAPASPLPPEVAMGKPLYPQVTKAHQPSEAQVPAPTVAHPHGYGEARSPQSPLPAAAAQGNGSLSDAPAQELPVAQGHPADAAPPPPAVASTSPEPGHPDQLRPPPAEVTMEQPVVPVPSTTPQQQGTGGYRRVIGKEMVRAGVRLIARVVGNSLF